MKAHELARQLLELPDLEVYVPIIYRRRGCSIQLELVSSIETPSGQEVPEGGAKSYEDLIETKSILLKGKTIADI